MDFSNFIEQLKWIRSINISLIDVIQIIVLSFALYYLAKSLYKTRAWILVKGLIIIGAMYLIICLTKMVVLQIVMQGVFSLLMIAIVIMLQPELQKIFELIGKKNLTNIKSLFVKKHEFDEWMSSDSVNEIIEACKEMSAVKTGALIVIEKSIPLHDCIGSGIKLRSHISRQLLLNIFEKNTPLHDGAVIIKDNKVEAATCYLPLSTSTDVDKNFGTRHRAALGIAETTDCVVVVVSEETGAISFCESDKMHHHITSEELTELLSESMRKSDELIVVDKKRYRGPMWLKLAAPIISIIIWLSVTIINDPITTKIIQNVSVNIVNEQVLDEAGHTYTIKNGNKISVKVKGRRSIVDELTKNDITATADLSNMSLVYSVPIEIKVNSNEDIEIITTNQMINLELENIVQVDLPIETVIVGDTDDDYVVLVKETDVKNLTVTCPESVAKTLDKVILSVDAYGKTNNFVSSFEPVVYNKSGELVENAKLTMSNSAIRVVVNVYEVKEVPITITLPTQDKNSDSYYVLNSYECETEFIRVAVINENVDFDSLGIELSHDNEGDTISSALINLEQYLPEDVVLAKNQPEQIAVELDMTKYVKMTMSLSGKNVKLTGYDANIFDATVDSVPSSITLYYNSLTVDPTTLNLELLNPSVKVQQNTAGKYSDVVTMTDIDGVEIVGEIVVKYTLKGKG